MCMSSVLKGGRAAVKSTLKLFFSFFFRPSVHAMLNKGNKKVAL